MSGEKEKRNMRLHWGLLASVLLAAVLCIPAWGDNAKPNAVPGTINYVEGQVEAGNQTLDSKSIGSAQLQTGESLNTETGKAEVLLTPGVFLRVGDNSSVRMISPSLTNTEVGIDKGQAIIEVDQIYSENDIRVAAQGTTTRLLKTGLYDFDANQGELRVFDGKASVQGNDKTVTVKGGHEIALAAQALSKPQKFDKKAFADNDLYKWSSLRSSYVAEANVNAARIYVDNGWGPWGPGWWGAGWYWDPWFGAYTFIPADGIFYSPFGWGFYSPWWVYQAPFYGAVHGYNPYYRHFSSDVRNWGPGPHYVGHPNYANGIYHGPGSPGGFRSGPTMMGAAPRSGVGGGFGGFNGGGFHGGVGFHGGGGFHGR
jgi:hypothetical protein